MTKSDRLKKKYGDPLDPVQRLEMEKNFLRLYVYPHDVAEKIPCLGKSVYMHLEFWPVYLRFLRLLIARKLHTELNSNDECYNVRMVRGSVDQLSVHSWAMAVDLNKRDNALGLTRNQLIRRGFKPFSPAFIQAANDVGLIAGAYFKRPDLMHFEFNDLKPALV